MKKYIAILVGIIALVPSEAQPLTGQVVITEIMYDLAEGSDSGREWIEVYNRGAATDLTAFKVVENNSQHKISANAGGTVAAGAFAVIADNAEKFKADFPGFAGLLFESTFSLNNTDESIGIANASGVAIDSVTYTNASANGTGDSLQRAPSGAQFEAGIPTPGSGIPAGGLQKSAPKAGKSAKKTTTKNLPPTSPVEIIGNPAPSTPGALVAAAATTQDSLVYWWFAPLLLAVVGSVGAVTARHYRKGEWDIVEEIEESS
ncbi:MAG: lamin tail domain-containing protein [Patescibacteria group bacterium]